MTRNYNDPIYEKARKEVLKRDKRKCRMPGCDSRRRLNVHHILEWSKAAALRFEPGNMITLCRQCHDSIKGKESHYVGLFLSIIGAK